MRLIAPDRDQWNAFVADSSGSQILQSWEWGEIKEAFGWEAIRLAIEEAGKMIAAASILKRKLPYLGKSIFYIPRGPILDFEDKDLFDHLSQAIKDEARKHKAAVLRIDPEIEKVLPGFRSQKKQVQPRATIFLDLKLGPEELLRRCEEKTRYNIRLAAKKGVTVKEDSGPSGVEIFYDLYKVTARRDEFLIHPKKYYDLVCQKLNNRGMAKIFIAYYEGGPIAAVWMFIFGKRIWYLYGASRSENRNVMPNHALHWEVIKWACQAGLELYDLWGIPVDPRADHPLFGVYRFKKGFNGEIKTFAGAMDLVYDPLTNYLFDKGLALYKNLRSLLTKGRIEDSLGE